MAKVGLENDTLKPPKCPSNWEYSTGQRQLLDIQSGKQMDRLSFSALAYSDNRKIVAFFCAFCGRVRDHIDNPPKPSFEKEGFVWSGKRASPKGQPSYKRNQVVIIHLNRANFNLPSGNTMNKTLLHTNRIIRLVTI